MFNPLLGHNVRDRTWYDIAEELQLKIAYTCLRGKPEGATQHLNVMDLIDTEASAYWREWGLELYSGKEIKAAQCPYRPPVEPAKVGVGELAYRQGPDAGSDEFAPVSII